MYSAIFNDCEDGKSTEAYVFYYARAPISWSSRKQDIVATPSRAMYSAIVLPVATMSCFRELHEIGALA
jgi:hypothetical protein